MAELSAAALQTLGCIHIRESHYCRACAAWSGYVGVGVFAMLTPGRFNSSACSGATRKSEECAAWRAGAQMAAAISSIILRRRNGTGCMAYSANKTKTSWLSVEVQSWANPVQTTEQLTGRCTRSRIWCASLFNAHELPMLTSHEPAIGNASSLHRLDREPLTELSIVSSSAAVEQSVLTSVFSSD